VALGEDVSIPVVDLPAPMTVPEIIATSRRPRSALPPDSPKGALTQIKPVEPPSSILRFDYDLDHGTPSTPGNHDPQRTF
jgi:hypothetical protein